MFHLKLLGGINVESTAGPLTGRILQRRRLALLAILTASRTRGVSRDRVIGLLWPESDRRERVTFSPTRCTWCAKRWGRRQ